MNLQKIIDKKDAAAQYMIDEITYICKNFEKRDPGSKGEQQACEYMAEVLKKDCGCDRADVESFQENPGSFSPSHSSCLRFRCFSCSRWLPSC